jgi:hypothetical protein
VYQPAVVGKFGYVMFKLKSVAPEYPATNVELVSRFLNGLDSDHWYCFQSVLQWSTVLNGYRRWTLFNFINNGYKLALGGSGTWISSQTVNEPEGPSWTVGQQPFLKIKYRPFSEGGGVIRSIVTDWEGHGPLGWGTTMQQSGAPGPCSWCIAYWDFEQVIDDDPGVYYPTSSIGSNFDDGPWIYKNGLFTAHTST